MIGFIKKLFGWAGEKTRKIVRNMDFLAGEWVKMKTGGIVFEVKRDYMPETGDTYLKYRCPKCNHLLTEGPCGGAAVNAVCEECRTNYGCLPGFDFPINLGIFDDGESATGDSPA